MKRIFSYFPPRAVQTHGQRSALCTLTSPCQEASQGLPSTLPSPQSPWGRSGGSDKGCRRQAANHCTVTTGRKGRGLTPRRTHRLPTTAPLAPASAPRAAEVPDRALPCLTQAWERPEGSGLRPGEAQEGRRLEGWPPCSAFLRGREAGEGSLTSQGSWGQSFTCRQDGST